MGEEPGGDWEEEAEIRYEKVRTRNHLLMYSQCDLYHFSNVKGGVTNVHKEDY